MWLLPWFNIKYLEEIFFNKGYPEIGTTFRYICHDELRITVEKTIAVVL